MPQTVRDVMTTNPSTCRDTDTLDDAARLMRDRDIGDVLVERDGSLCGIITDRDIVVRAVAEGRDPASMRLGDVCTADLTTLSPDDSVDRAVTLMRDCAVRRLPVAEDGHAVGILSLGDLAMERDAGSALGRISAAAPNS